MKAYYFSAKDRQLRHGDWRHIRTGRTHKVEGPPRLCIHGLHASIKPLDALQYAPGPYLWEVKLSGEIVKSDDKCCATERTYLRGFNAEGLLREFARKQAKINIHKIKPYCSEQDFELIINWLETGDESLRLAARSAARSAVIPIARSAAESAADSAAWSAEAAARPAAEAAAWATAVTAAETAAWSAAWAAARSAAKSAANADLSFSGANSMLQKMIDERFAAQQRRGQGARDER